MTQKQKIFTSASEQRLEKLIEERLLPGTDKDRIDRRIWDLFGEEWCVMFTDLSGFSRGVARFGIIHFLQTIYEAERVLIPILEDHDGILLKTEGDSFLVIFRNAKKAVLCSIEMQKILKSYNQDKQPEDQVLLCVGLGFGKVLKVGDADVFGAEVNAASKLGEDTAEPYEILITGNVKAQIADMEKLGFEELSEAPSGAEKAYRVLYPL